uniref:Uncharacterized protein n=1 Tax=Physcomitrium patens TaxID=3218 RepID=A0A2K1IAI1_PHYPA|nr:hypothetical protein PHYPA_030859 [Physcomitrium patens]
MMQPVLGGASNWIGKFKKGAKSLSDCRPWSVPKILKNDLAPFSTLRIQPRDEEGNCGDSKGKRVGKGEKKRCGNIKPCPKPKGWTINCERKDSKRPCLTNSEIAIVSFSVGLCCKQHPISEPSLSFLHLSTFTTKFSSLDLDGRDAASNDRLCGTS